MTLKIAFEKPSTQPVLCLGVFEDNAFPEATEAWDKKLKGFLKQSIGNSKFKGSLDQFLVLFVPDGPKLVLVGLGKKADQNEGQWQKIGSSLVGALNSSSSGEGAVEIHSLDNYDTAKVVSNMALGASLKAWRFEKYFTTKKPEELFSLKKITFLSPQPEACDKAFEPLKAIVEGVSLTRTVVTEPANVITPESLAHVAESLKKDGVSVEILDEKEMKLLGMNALLGVGQGSSKDSKLVVMRWQGGGR